MRFCVLTSKLGMRYLTSSKHYQKKSFKKKFKKSLLEILKTEDSYIEFNKITRKLKQCKIYKV